MREIYHLMRKYQKYFQPTFIPCNQFSDDLTHMPTLIKMRKRLSVEIL